MKKVSDATHSIVSRLLILVFTLATVLLNTNFLGEVGMGSVALLQFGLLLVTGMAGFMAAGAVVYVRRQHRPKDLRLPAYLWCIFASVAASISGVALGLIPSEWLIASAFLGLLQSLVVFHAQILIAAGKIRSQNYLHLLQTFSLLVATAVFYLYLDLATPVGFAYALCAALAVTFVFSALSLKGSWEDSPTVSRHKESASVLLWRHGRQGQTGSILQLLTNRANLSLLDHYIGSAGAGVYAVVYYGVEAIWTIARALAPMVHSEVAAATEKVERMEITTKYLRKTLILTLPLIAASAVIPESIYEWIFGISGISFPLLILIPGMIAGATSSILAHHLSGVGLHIWNARTSGAGLVTLLAVGFFCVPLYGVVGAAISASCAYLVQAMGLFWVWRRVAA